jgi:hypothetical protein
MRLLNHLAMFYGPNEQSTINALVMLPPTHILSKFECYGKSCPVCVHYLTINKEPYVPTTIIQLHWEIRWAHEYVKAYPQTIPKRHFNLQMQVENSRQAHLSLPPVVRHIQLYITTHHHQPILCCFLLVMYLHLV